MESETYQKVKAFKKKYPRTVAWRLKSHCKIADVHLNPGEIVKSAFVAQKNNNIFDIITTYVVVLTNRRLLLANKRLLWGYYCISITPDLFNDLNVYHGLIWGKVAIDTIKEIVYLSNIDPNALPEIETEISTFMMKEKRRYGQRNNQINVNTSGI